MKSNWKLIFGILIGALLFGSIGGYAASMLSSKDITYTASNTDFKAGNVSDALDEIYCMAKEKQEVISYTASNVTATSNTGNKVGKVTLNKGTYVVSAFASYQGNDLRYHITLGDYSSSAYDNKGYVRMSITNIIEITTDNSDVWFSIWPSDKTVTLDTVKIKAIRLY